MIANSQDIESLIEAASDAGLELRKLEGLAADRVYVGRASEMEMAMARLGCSDRCNLLITGNAGTGKSTFVEVLAARLQRCPSRRLSRMRVLSMNLGSTIADTRYRGELEKKCSTLIELMAAYENLCVFVDEAHALRFTASSGGLGMMDLLKPHLLGSGFRVILATTTAESSYLKQDAAFMRRFFELPLAELTAQEVSLAVEKHSERLAAFHGFPDEVRNEVVKSLEPNSKLPLHLLVDEIDFRMSRLMIRKSHAEHQGKVHL